MSTRERGRRRAVRPVGRKTAARPGGEPRGDPRRGARGTERARLRPHDDQGVAARAGVTHGLVMRHFGTKEKLFLAAIRDHSDWTRHSRVTPPRCRSGSRGRTWNGWRPRTPTTLRGPDPECRGQRPDRHPALLGDAGAQRGGVPRRARRSRRGRTRRPDRGGTPGRHVQPVRRPRRRPRDDGRRGAEHAAGRPATARRPAQLPGR
ncbi:helix-turn-helix domain-containing protein [Streptomyces sp. M19]